MDKKIAKKLRELGVMAVVSLDGSNEKEHDFLRGEGAFKKTIKGIKTLKDEDVYVVTNYICHRGNYRNLDRYFELSQLLERSKHCRISSSGFILTAK